MYPEDVNQTILLFLIVLVNDDSTYRPIITIIGNIRFHSTDAITGMTHSCRRQDVWYFSNISIIAKCTLNTLTRRYLFFWLFLLFFFLLSILAHFPMSLMYNKLHARNTLWINCCMMPNYFHADVMNFHFIHFYIYIFLCVLLLIGTQSY